MDIPEWHSVMDDGRDAGIEEIIAECGGSCSCSTCHVHVNRDWFDRLSPVEPMEEKRVRHFAGEFALVENTDSRPTV